MDKFVSYIGRKGLVKIIKRYIFINFKQIYERIQCTGTKYKWNTKSGD
jgi:hypothetical protein